MRLLFFLLSLISLSSSNYDGENYAVLTQEMLDSTKKTFIVKKDYSLMGEKLVVPQGVSLVFRGGSLFNGEIIGTNTKLKVLCKKPVFGINLVITGTWDVPEVHDGWFCFDDSPDFVSNQLIKNILSLSNDSTECHIIFEESRTYLYELPYKGRTDIGNLFSYKVIKGEKKRNFFDVYKDEFSYLRIFTIPSNTHLTINNTLKMLPTNQGAYFVFWEYGKENITIDGDGVIAGDNDGHLYETPFTVKGYYGEWGHIFRCFKCHNFTFRDITISDAFGDCIIYSGSYFPEETGTRFASYLTLDNVKILRARRNGVAVGARHVRIKDCYFEQCGSKSVKGTPPRSAIDFEADNVKYYPEIGNEDVIMENCSFVDNYFDVASYLNTLSGFGKTATTIRNCKFTASLKIQGTYWMQFENCSIPFVYNTEDERSIMLYSKHMAFVNCDFGEYDTTELGSLSNCTNRFVNCRFNTNCKNADD